MNPGKPPLYHVVLTGLADLLWPPACMICGSRIQLPTECGSLCPGCRTAVLTDVHEICPRCSSTVGPHTDTADGCLRCRGTPLRFTGASRLGPYDGTLREAVLRMKSLGGEPLAETLGELWADARRDRLRADEVDAVVPVPLHWRRRWGRGYNQAEAVARGLARQLGKPIRPGWLARVRPTAQQRTFTPTERWSNVRGAFRIGRRAAVRGVRVLLVDDVMTTGATASEAAGVLLDAGAAQVRLAVLAHR